MSEVAEVGTLESVELSRVSISRDWFYEEHAGAGLLEVNESQGSFDQMKGATVAETEITKLQQENMQLKAQMKKMQQQLDLMAKSARVAQDLL